MDIRGHRRLAHTRGETSYQEQISWKSSKKNESEENAESLGDDDKERSCPEHDSDRGAATHGCRAWAVI